MLKERKKCQLGLKNNLVFLLIQIYVSGFKHTLNFDIFFRKRDLVYFDSQINV